MENLTITIPAKPDIPWKDRLIAGMMLIRKYEPDADYAAGHDVIYFGNYETREQMTDEEKALMDAWHWYEEYDSWCYSV